MNTIIANNILLLVNIFNIALGASSVALLFFIYTKYKNNLIKFYFFFTLVLSAYIYLGIIIHFLEVTIPSGASYIESGKFILLFFWFLAFAFYLVRFIYQLTETPVRLIEKIIFIIMVLLQVCLLVYPFIYYSSIEDILQTLNFEFAVIDSLILMIIVYYIIFLLLFRYRKARNDFIKRIMRFIIILIITFLVITLIFGLLFGFSKLMYYGYYFVVIYFFLWNVVSLSVIIFDLSKKMKITSFTLETLSDEFLKRFSFTERESEIVKYLFEDHTYEKIRQSLFISVKTVEKHVSNIYMKMGVKNREELKNKIIAFEILQ